jgi:hypothetical protein
LYLLYTIVFLFFYTTRKKLLKTLFLVATCFLFEYLTFTMHKLFYTQQNIIVSLIDYSGVLEHYYIIVALLLLFVANFTTLYRKSNYFMYAHIFILFAFVDFFVGNTTIIYLNYNVNVFNPPLLNGLFVVHPLLMLTFYISFYIFVSSSYLEQGL